MSSSVFQWCHLWNVLFHPWQGAGQVFWNEVHVAISDGRGLLIAIAFISHLAHLLMLDLTNVVQWRLKKEFILWHAGSLRRHVRYDCLVESQDWRVKDPGIVKGDIKEIIFSFAEIPQKIKLKRHLCGVIKYMQEHKTDARLVRHTGAVKYFFCSTIYP